MVEHRFGGWWTEQKLEVLQKYLEFYTTAMGGKSFRLVYIDAFAGTGRCEVKVSPTQNRLVDGSAKLALDCRRPFSEYHFIERKAKHAQQLASVLAQHPRGQLGTVHQGDATQELPRVLGRFAGKWRDTRGVLFLDPYGLQCTWDMVKMIAETRALDVFFLVSLSGLYRQAAVNEQGIDAGKAARLSTFLGTEEWRAHLYVNRQIQFFGFDDSVTRTPGYEPILDFMTERLKTVFGHVAAPVVLGRVNGAPLFALYFAVASRHPKAIDLAKRVSGQILKPLR